MTQRSELQHRIVETREVALTWVANRLFTFKQDGLDGFIKRRMLNQGSKPKAAAVREAEAGQP